MTRRNVELLLLCLASPFVILLFGLDLLNAGSLTLHELLVPFGLFAAFVAAHIGVRIFAQDADPAILPITFALSGIGIAFITRLAPDLALRQIAWLLLGIVCMVLVLALVKNLDKLARYKYTFVVLGIALLLMPLLPVIGHEELGSRIWIKVGSMSFQPGELAKLSLVIFLAGYLAQNREMISVFTVRVGRLRLPDVATLAPLLVMWGISFLIAIFEKDLGSALVVFVLFLIMLYVASGKKLFLIVGFGLAAIGCVVLYAAFSHIQIRVNTWLNPFADAMNTGYQLSQTIYSLADGGLFGVGIGRGLAQNIPVVESDFIFAAIAEETGLLGAAGVLLLYLCFAVRGFATAARAKSDVSSFVAIGATTTIVLQAFIIVGGVTRLIPLTGLTLPFISQGGSSLLASFIGVGLMLRCGDEATGLNSEVKDGTISMKAINPAVGSGETGVLGRVVLGRRITATMVGFALLFAALVANLTCVMVVMADEYQNYPGNTHSLYREARSERGSISTYDGVVLAKSELTDNGTYQRVYPQGALASHVVGYYSRKYGLSGIELSMNDTLKGQRNFANWTDVIDSFSGKETPGNDVALTLNSKIQKSAQNVLEGYKGAVVALDPTTGAVLACASSPTFNNDDVDKLLAAAQDNNDNGELVNRATDALYAPGSTFKIITASALIEHGLATESTKVNAPASITIGNAPVTNAENQGYGTISLKRAFEVSSNTAFGELGADKLGAKLLVQSAKNFGFDAGIDGFKLPLYTSVMPDPKEMTTWETAWAACGQPVGEHKSPAGPQATVMQMAQVASCIANGGVMMQPYIVQSVYNARGQQSFSAQSKTLATPISPTTADSMRDMMIGVVKNGTGVSASLPKIQVAGKTGTAETNKEYNNSWFVGFAPADNPKVVVAVLIEEGVHGRDESGLAAPRAKKVMQTALEVQGLL